MTRKSGRSPSDIEAEEERIRDKYRIVMEKFGPMGDSLGIKEVLDGSSDTEFSECVSIALARVPDADGDPINTTRARMDREVIVGECVRRVTERRRESPRVSSRSNISGIVDDIMRGFSDD